MLAGKKAGEVLTLLLADPNRFLENGELEDADWEPPQPGQSTALSRDIPPAVGDHQPEDFLGSAAKGTGFKLDYS